MKPGNFKDESAFFVTQEMMENPSETLFRGKHQLIGKMFAASAVNMTSCDRVTI